MSINKLRIPTFFCFTFTVVLVLLHPAFHTIADLLSKNSNIISILLSLITLWLLLTSTMSQVNQTRINQLHSARSLQIELLRIALEVPEYRKVLGSNFSKLDTTAWRQHAYLNMWMMYLQMSFLTGSISEKGIRRVFSGEFFNGEPGINYWVKVRTVLSEEASSRHHKKFIQIVNEEYNKSVTARQVDISKLARTAKPDSHKRENTSSQTPPTKPLA